MCTSIPSLCVFLIKVSANSCLSFILYSKMAKRMTNIRNNTQKSNFL